MRALGLMSGTSVDGVDVALIETDGERVASFGPTLTVPYPDEVRRLIIVAVEEPIRLGAMFLQEADAADGVGMQQLLISRHDLAADLIVVWGDCSHLMFHYEPPRYVR